MRARLTTPWSDRRAERVLGALASLVLVSIVLMIVFVAVRALATEGGAALRET